MSDLVSGPFTFDGDLLALDLVNTRVVVRGKHRDLLQTPEDVATWWNAACHYRPEMDRAYGTQPIFDMDLLTAVKTFRDSLRRLFIVIIEGGQPDAADMDTLNQVMRMGFSQAAWDTEQRKGAVYWSCEQAQAGILLPVALSALKLLTEFDLSRLHKCQNERCVLLFYDSSKSATRLYCSTACLDRERSSLRYAESKRESHDH